MEMNNLNHTNNNKDEDHSDARSTSHSETRSTTHLSDDKERSLAIDSIFYNPNLYDRVGENDLNSDARTNLGALSPTSHNFEIRSDYEGGFAESLPDVNVYQHKKTVAQGMMDLALFSANANQLRYVLESNNHPYYYPGIILISTSLIFQVVVGVGLLWNTQYNVKREKEIHTANSINNITIVGIFLVTVINVFISAFGVAANSSSPSQELIAVLQSRFGGENSTLNSTEYNKILAMIFPDMNITAMGNITEF